jgi:preprotein translocase subunit SecD
MGAVRHLRTLLPVVAPLALVAGLLAACGHDSSSSSSVGDSTILGSSGGFEIRPVFARYAPGVPFGPQLPQALVDELKAQSCPMKPRVVQSMLMECDLAKTVYLLKNPVVSGDVATAAAKQVGHKDIWYIQVGLDDTGTAAMDSLIKDQVGTELAFSYGGKVLTSVAVDPSLHPDRLALIGDFDKAQAHQLASQLTG